MSIFYSEQGCSAWVVYVDLRKYSRELPELVDSFMAVIYCVNWVAYVVGQYLWLLWEKGWRGCGMVVVGGGGGEATLK